jgi:DNA-binding transcriptional ArsR family regulator
VTDLETHQITDAREMRALAHPLRLRLIGLLRIDGPATASVLATAVGVTPALASYHLRQLGRYGFVVEDPELARDGRERWWRAAQARTSWDSAAFLDTPDRIAALSSLHREQFLAYQRRLDEHLHDVAALDADWVAATNHSDYILELDADGLRALNAELDALVERYRTDPPRAAAPTKTITVIVHSFPRPEGL